MPQAIRDVIDSWEIACKSPHSHSYYNVREGEKTWEITPLGSLRVSDHWNFGAHGAVHCPTDVPVRNDVNWALGQYDGEKYVLLLVLPRLKTTALTDEEAERLLSPRNQEKRKKNLEHLVRSEQYRAKLENS